VLKAALKTCLRAVIVLENEDRIGGVVEMDRETVRESSLSRWLSIENKYLRSTYYVPRRCKQAKSKLENFIKM